MFWRMRAQPETATCGGSRSQPWRSPYECARCIGKNRPASSCLQTGEWIGVSLASSEHAGLCAKYPTGTTYMRGENMLKITRVAVLAAALLVAATSAVVPQAAQAQAQPPAPAAPAQPAAPSAAPAPATPSAAQPANSGRA